MSLSSQNSNQLGEVRPHPPRLKREATVEPLGRDHPRQISAGSTLRWITVVWVFCRGQSQHKCQSRHKQDTKSHHCNCDGIISGNLEHRETLPRSRAVQFGPRNGRRWISSSSKKAIFFV